MTLINYNEKLDVQCPHCSTKFTKTIRELKAAGVKCPQCGVGFETSKFKKGIDEAERSLKEFARGLKNIKIHIRL